MLTYQYVVLISANYVINSFEANGLLFKTIENLAQDNGTQRSSINMDAIYANVTQIYEKPPEQIRQGFGSPVDFSIFPIGVLDTSISILTLGMGEDGLLVFIKPEKAIVVILYWYLLSTLFIVVTRPLLHRLITSSEIKKRIIKKSSTRRFKL